jgi:hypothetical protein
MWWKIASLIAAPSPEGPGGDHHGNACVNDIRARVWERQGFAASAAERGTGRAGRQNAGGAADGRLPAQRLERVIGGKALLLHRSMIWANNNAGRDRHASGEESSQGGGAKRMIG